MSKKKVIFDETQLSSEMEEFGRKCFYEGREIAYNDDKGRAIFTFPTYNGYLRYLETADEIEKKKINE